MASPWFREEHHLFRQSIREFVEKEVVPNAPVWERQGFIPREVWERMGDLGFLGINHEERFGGSAADFFYSVVYLEELARSTMGGFTSAVSVHQYMATAHIARVGSPYLQERFLRPAVHGRKWGALGISEPGAGSDVAAIRTTAVRDGDHYVINGSKTFITNGVNGDFVTLACKTNPAAGAGGISLIVVEQGTPGFSSNNLHKMGWHSSDTGELAFDDVRVPVANLVGQENQGFYYIMDSFQLERLVAAILSIGGARHALEIALKYLDEREAFGRKLNRYQVLRHRMVDLATELEAAEQFVYHTAWLYERGEFAVRQCSMAKLLTSELGLRMADACLQCFGGYGFMEEYPIARMYRDARAATIVGGTSEIMREIVGKMLFDGASYQPAYGGKDSPPAATASGSNGAPGSAANGNTGSGSNGSPSARELLLGLPGRFRPEKAQPDLHRSFHFALRGEGGGDYTVQVRHGGVEVIEGLNGQADCLVEAEASDYANLELGRLDPQTAFLSGKVRISDLGAMMAFTPLFKRWS